MQCSIQKSCNSMHDCKPICCLLIGKHDEHLTKILLSIPSYDLPDNSLHESGKRKDPLLSNCKPMYNLDLLEEWSHSNKGYSLPFPSLVSPYSPFSELQHIISSHHQIIKIKKTPKTARG